MFAELLENTLRRLEELVPAERRVGLNSVVGPAAGPAWDCPMLYVSLAGSSRVEDSTGCVTHTDLVLRVGIVREVCVVDDRGIAPSPREVTADGLEIARDADALIEALESVVPSDLQVHSFDPTSWTPLGPEGGMAGGEWNVNVRVVL